MHPTPQADFRVDSRITESKPVPVRIQRGADAVEDVELQIQSGETT